MKVYGDLPSNGTMGGIRLALTCDRCVKDHAFHRDAEGDGDEGCEILLSAFMGEGPQEWWEDDETREAGCTAFEGPCPCDGAEL